MKTTVRMAILIIAMVLGLSLLLVLARLPQQKTAVLPEAVTILEQNQPVSSPTEERLWQTLEQKAVSGGPPKDGIPAIDHPQYTSAQEADKWLWPQDIVFGVNYKKFIAAYPQRILVWHEVANEEINGEKISITYCPLTGTTFGFKGTIASGVSSSFGVSGKLVNSNLIMYDRTTDSYWPQILGQAITGPAKGIALEEFPIIWTTWARWKKKYPDTKVLSKETGFIRNYDRGGDPYGSYLDDDRGYYSSDYVLFRPINTDNRLAPKTVVVGVRDKKGNAAAVLKDKLRKEKKLEVLLGEVAVVITYDADLDAPEAKIKKTGDWLYSVEAMWFSWAGFYPATKLLD